MKRLAQGSFWLSLLEQLIYVAPTLSTILYYYFTELEQVISKSSKASFGLALVIFVLLCIYRYFAKVKLQELRQATVQTETDLMNTPECEAERRKLLATNACKQRAKLDGFDRLMLTLIFIIIGLSEYILEQATIGIFNLILIAIASCVVGTGVHYGVLELHKKELIKVKKKKN